MASSSPSATTGTDTGASADANPLSQPPATTSSDNQTPTSNAPAKAPAPKVDSDDDSDFDDLDEVLDDFKPTSKPASAPAPDASASAAPTADNFDEEAFLKQLEKDMASMMGGGAPSASADNTNTNNQNPLDNDADADAEAFAKYFEESGVNPADFLKQLVGDVIMKGEDSTAPTGTAGSTTAPPPPPAPSSASASASGTAGAAGQTNPETFNDTIQRTINRMKESGDKATAAASEDELSDDLVAQLLKAIEAGAGGAGGEDGDGDLTKMFMGMMEQLSNKEILYEPMKELDTKFGPWLEENKGKGTVSKEDMERFEKQAAVVKVIVEKFEEKGYSDEDPACREFVWVKMQEMQAAGNPPDELISAPWMEDLKGPGGAGPGGPGMPDCPQQ
ncbi:Pex19-domain-containing protein [Aspergillus ellipticus CBS 707.79]|uniref:Pex19-domain-containing protein n=1 Tax=Aspergillus ellipticus CBS 707.79 TaxID=1448320 RepID=A0A319DYH4_9EURO|nr:Pex19-domain-containing protein [Aspergillus ellipticus CBS 707.79]